MKTILAWIFASLLWGSLGIVMLFLFCCMVYYEPLMLIGMIVSLIIFAGGIWGTAYLSRNKAFDKSYEELISEEKEKR